MTAKTLGQVLDETALKFPDNEAVVFQDQRIRYRDLQDYSNRFAKGLMAIGLEKGDKVSVWISNRPEWVIAKFGVAKIGGILVPINTRFKVSETKYILEQSDSKSLIMMDQFLKIDFMDMIFSICPELKGASSRSFQCDALPMLKSIVIIGKSEHPTVYSFQTILELGEGVDNEEFKDRIEKVSPEDVVNIQYTSGTTAFPKGVMLSHASLAEEAFKIGERLKITENDRLLSVMPYFHCGGSVNTILLAVVYGACIVSTEYFETEDVLKTIEKEKCTIHCGLEAMFVMEMNHPNFADYDVKSLRAGFSTGSKTTLENIRHKMGMEGIVSIYGLTECSPGVAIGNIDDTLETRLIKTGKPLPGVDVQIIDPKTEQPAPKGKVGEIRVKGFNVMKGYYKLPQETNDTLTIDGWLKTGDLGYIDEEGYLTFVGRLKDIIRSGGENISPSEVENFMRQFPKIKDVSVVKRPDERLGEVPAAFVTLKENTSCSTEEIINYCQGKIANFKIPKHIYIIEEFPMTGSGKIHRVQLEKWASEPE